MDLWKLLQTRVSTPGDRHTGTVSPHLCYVVPAVCSWSLSDSVIGDGMFAFYMGELEPAEIINYVCQASVYSLVED